MTTPIIVRIIATVLISAYLWAVTKSRSISSITWEELVARLNPVRMQDLNNLAAETQLGSNSRGCLRDKYLAIGGHEGIRRIRQNAKTLIILAAYAETWKPGVSADVVRLMRADGFRLQRAAWKISLLSLALHKDTVSSSWLRDLSGAYCNMTNQLLQLYSVAHVAKRPQLLAACGYL